MTNKAASKLAHLRWSRIPKHKRQSPNPLGRPKTLAACPHYASAKHRYQDGVCKCGFMKR